MKENARRRWGGAYLIDAEHGSTTTFHAEGNQLGFCSVVSMADVDD